MNIAARMEGLADGRLLVIARNSTFVYKGKSAEYLNYLGYAYRFMGRYEDAIEVHKKALKRSPNNLYANIYLTADYIALGREEEARQQAEELIRLDPAFSLEQLREMHPMKDKTELRRLISDVRKARLN